MDIIKIENLKKSYGEVEAVKGISFVVKQGELFAFLGINGAGKSTTINIISGSLGKDGGKVYINGKDLDSEITAIKADLGIVFQQSVLDKVLSVKDNLMLRGGLYGMNRDEIKTRIEMLSEMLNLEEIMKRKVKNLSGGQRRRADIARALIHNPKILIMDEPTTGLDPQTRSLLWDVLAKLRKEGLTIFLTTHYMEEAVDADYCIIIDDGRIATKGRPVELKAKHTNDFMKIYTNNLQNCYDHFAAAGFNAAIKAGHIQIEIENTEAAKAIIAEHGDYINDFEVLKGDMNSVFLNVTGKELRGA